MKVEGYSTGQPLLRVWCLLWLYYPRAVLTGFDNYGNFPYLLLYCQDGGKEQQSMAGTPREGSRTKDAVDIGVHQLLLVH